MNFNKIFWKNGTYENIKNDKTPKLYTPFREYTF